MKKDERISFGLTTYMLGQFGISLYYFAKARGYFMSPSYNFGTMKDQMIFSKRVPFTTNVMLISNSYEDQANFLGRKYLHVVKQWDDIKGTSPDNRRPSGFPFELFFY